MRQSWLRPGGSGSNDDEPDPEDLYRKHMMASWSLPMNKPTRTRTAFTTAQVQYLESKFKQDPYATGDLRKEISDVLKLPEKCIKLWYQNRRIREKYNKDKKATNFHFHNRSISAEYLNELSDASQEKIPPILDSSKSLPKAASSRSNLSTGYNMWYQNGLMKENYNTNKEADENDDQRFNSNKYIYELTPVVPGRNVPEFFLTQTSPKPASSKIDINTACTNKNENRRMKNREVDENCHKQSISNQYVYELSKIFQESNISPTLELSPSSSPDINRPEISTGSQNQWMKDIYYQNQLRNENYQNKSTGSEYVYKLTKFVQEGSMPILELSQISPKSTINSPEISAGYNTSYQNLYMKDIYNKNKGNHGNYHNRSNSSEYAYESTKFFQEGSMPSFEISQTLPKAASTRAERSAEYKRLNQNRWINENNKKYQVADQNNHKRCSSIENVHESTKVVQARSMPTLELSQALPKATTRAEKSTESNIRIHNQKIKEKYNRDNEFHEQFHKKLTTSENIHKLTCSQEKNMPILESPTPVPKLTTSKSSINIKHNNMLLQNKNTKDKFNNGNNADEFTQERNIFDVISTKTSSKVVTSKTEMTGFNQNSKTVEKVPTLRLNYYKERPPEPDITPIYGQNNIKKNSPKVPISQPDYKASAEFSIELYKKYKNLLGKYKNEEKVHSSIQKKLESGNTPQTPLFNDAGRNIPYYYIPPQDFPQDLSIKKRRSN